MINLGNVVNAIFLEKFMTVEKLQKILAQLQPGDNLYPNQVGNLIVQRNGEDIGYIDFGSEEYSGIIYADN